MLGMVLMVGSGGGDGGGAVGVVAVMVLVVWMVVVGQEVVVVVDVSEMMVEQWCRCCWCWSNAGVRAEVLMVGLVVLEC